MFTPQSSLGEWRPMGNPIFNSVKLCRVTSTSEFETTQKVSLVTFNGSVPRPAYVLGTGKKCPVSPGDVVLIGLMDGYKDNPVVLGSVMGWGPLFGLQDMVGWNDATEALTVQHPTSGAKIVMDKNGNMTLTPGGSGKIIATNVELTGTINGHS